ncbi:hypothetical protein NMG60_11035142 [Bertholletia excelsa]
MKISLTFRKMLLVIIPFLLNCCARSDFASKACKKTEFPDLCNSILRSDCRSASSVKGLVIVLLEVAHANASDIFNLVNSLPHNTIDPVLE